MWALTSSSPLGTFSSGKCLHFAPIQNQKEHDHLGAMVGCEGLYFQLNRVAHGSSCSKSMASTTALSWLSGSR